MMIECPRCGFAQPKDQYCASCGLNIDQYVAKPKPIWLRTLQNPNFHLSMIGILIAVVVGWIFYTQRANLGREVGQLLDLPVSSKDAAVPGEDPVERKNQAPAAAQAAMTAPEPTPEEPVEEVKAAEVAPPPAPPEPVATAKTKLEMSFWEIQHDILLPLLANGERAGEGNGGRAFYFADPTKLIEALTKQGQAAGTARTSPLTTGSQILVETPATGSEAFQFLMQVQVTKAENKEIGLNWQNSMILPQGEPQGVAPPQLVQTILNGQTSLALQGALIVLPVPSVRAPAESYLTKAGEGPWSIFSSPEFRAGLTDWVILVQLK